MSVTAIIPAHNAERTIMRAVESIRRQLTPTTIVVVDDASTDGTAEISENLADVVIRLEENQGPAAARNAGIASVATPYVAFLDADDTWTSARLGPMIKALERNGEADAVIGATRFKTPTTTSSMGFPIEDGTIAVVPKFCSLLVRGDVFEVVGPIDESLRHYEDYDWMLRAADLGVGFVTLTEVVTEYQQRRAGLSAATGPHTDVLMAVLKRSAKRKKGLSPGEAVRGRAPKWGLVDGASGL